MNAKSKSEENKEQKDVLLREILEEKNAFAARINGEIKDADTRIKKDDKIEILDFNDKEARNVFWHSTAHLLAHAVTLVFKDAKPTIGPAIEEGFYYDFDMQPLSPNDLKILEEKMKELVNKKIPIVRKKISIEYAKKIFKDNPYKLELIEELKNENEEVVSVYQQGDFVDLCRGPHVPNTSLLKNFKLLKVSGAYWRGDSSNKQLQRIYGISFPTKEELENYLKMREEAEKRDHRKIGKELDLFSFHEEGPGFPFIHPKGMIILNELIDYWREVHRKAGYQEIKTPIILNKELWIRSGHWDHYKDNMYFTKIDNLDFAIKPMNCPGGILVYKSRIRSYKDFPLKLAEFGLVHRHELSGVIGGLFRVRAFTQDDAHIFVSEEQIEKSITELIELINSIYKKFGFEYHVELSTRPENYMGSLELWNKAEDALKKALDDYGLKYKINEGDGAFYGPKIDFHIKDCIGRTWQCATIQLDFQMPLRFELSYEGKDGRKHIPVMIHRVVYGSLERFFGILIEHFGGKFPLWLSPIQIVILTVADRHVEYANNIKEKMENEGLRVEIDDSAETIPKKVRNAQIQKIPLIITIGDKEVESKTLAVRTLDGKVLFGVKPEKLLKELKENITNRELKFNIKKLK
ncbi:MAG: threonine--tRNA ligase [Candidatus Woesearchaeota archaeon]